MYQGKYVAAKPAGKKRKKRITAGSVIFYFLYFLAIAAFAVGLNYALSALGDWLTDFEASQPDNKSQQIFDQYFANPDWAEIYTMAQQQDTYFETKDAYAAYMTEKVGNSRLTFSKTSAGLTGGQKYIVKLNGENIATYTLTNRVESDLEIPQWELQGIEIFYTRNEHVSIHTQQGCTISVNGVALDESYLVSTTSTVVENYLPEGVHGKRSVSYYVDGLLYAPKIEVVDEAGNAVEMVYNAENKSYTPAPGEEVPMSDAERTVIVDGTKAYCRKMIGASSTWTKYFKKSSAIYNFITRNELWFSGYTKYEFEEPSITDYYRYTDSLVSARIAIKLNVYRSNGTVKVFDVDNTLFLEKNSSGNWMIIDMTSVDVQEELTQVKLTYMYDDQVVHTEMVSSTSATLTLPEITVPEDKVFSGWFQESVDESGNKKWSLVFAPSEDGTVSLPAGYVLEHMVLHALTENKGA